jgi:hypothetical protein
MNPTTTVSLTPPPAPRSRSALPVRAVHAAVDEHVDDGGQQRGDDERRRHQDAVHVGAGEVLPLVAGTRAKTTDPTAAMPTAAPIRCGASVAQPVPCRGT